MRLFLLIVPLWGWSVVLSAQHKAGMKERPAKAPPRVAVKASLSVKDSSLIYDKKRNGDLARQLIDLIKKNHYAPKKLDDTLSKSLFRLYLEYLDYDKSIFLQSDIDFLQAFTYRLDDELKAAKFDFVEAVAKRYNERIRHLLRYYPKVLQGPFDFTLSDSIVFNDSLKTYPKTVQELERRWYLKLKFMTLVRYCDYLQLREKKTRWDSAAHQWVLKPDEKDTAFVIKADTALEREARMRVEKIVKKMFFRYQKKKDMQDKIDMYLNAFCSYMDPHTNYLPPLDKRALEEGMSKRFYGIGAQLQQSEGGMKIIKVLSGGAAWKTGQVQPGDLIIKVGQGEKGEMEDLAGYDLEEAVRLIRGEKNSKLRLSLKKSGGGNIITLLLERREVKQEEALVHSAIVQQGHKKIGYIYLPDFYADFNDRQGAQSAVDVAIEIDKLNRNNVDGIVIDLRNNGGGSLSDVVQIGGYFIFKGPIVQIKDKEDRVRLLNDHFGWIDYSGPLVVMVNEFSASASEIFAAVIQDYKRGLVVGTQTYGKGSVQTQINLRPFLRKGKAADNLGSLKVTIQKFYRINGGSTQLRGVMPDVILPSRYEYAKVRERDAKYFLPWDNVPKAAYKEWDYYTYSLSDLARREARLLDTNQLFKTIDDNAKWLSERRDDNRSLNKDLYQKEEKQIQRISDTLNKLLAISEKDTIEVMPANDWDKVDTAAFKTIEEKDKWKMKKGNYDNWLKAVKRDVYVKETMKIMERMILGGDYNKELISIIEDKKVLLPSME